MTNQDLGSDLVAPELQAGILEDYSLYKSEVRRSADTSAAFYDKLAALSAGSIAISVSIGLAIFSKQDLQRLSHGLLAMIVCFWLSLMSALGHGFLLRSSAKLDAAYSREQFTRDAIKGMIHHSSSETTQLCELKKAFEPGLQEGPLAEQRAIAARKSRREAIAEWFGYVAVASFVSGYILVLCGSLMLWL